MVKVFLIKYQIFWMLNIVIKLCSQIVCIYKDISCTLLRNTVCYKFLVIQLESFCRGSIVLKLYPISKIFSVFDQYPNGMDNVIWHRKTGIEKERWIRLTHLLEIQFNSILFPRKVGLAGGTILNRKTRLPTISQILRQSSKR